MKFKVQSWTRRRVVRGMLGGTAVTVGLPILDCVLNDNGSAFADTGAPLPTRFASWFWPLGFGEKDYRPAEAGKNYEMPWQLEALQSFKSRLNLFSGSHVALDGAPNQTHFTGVQGYFTGKVTASGDYFNSVDAIIANAIGARSRFRSLTAVCDGDPKASWTAFASGKVPGEVSPAALYSRIFGPEFTDPNAASFVPDPETLSRRSVLSGIVEQRAALDKQLGAADRQKIEYYFTALRSLEQKLDIQLQKPAGLPSCSKPDAAQDDGQALYLASAALERHDLFCNLMTHAMACDQTRVVALNITQGMTGLRREGDPTSDHSYTHEEPIDPTLGYQVKVSWFTLQYFQHLREFLFMLDSVKEGDGTLLGHMLLMAHTCHGAPRLHSLQNYPFITVGGASGRVKTGMHVPMPGDMATRVSFTVQQAMGVPTASFGTGSNQVNRPVSGVLT